MYKLKPYYQILQEMDQYISELERPLCGEVQKIDDSLAGNCSRCSKRPKT